MYTLHIGPVIGSGTLKKEKNITSLLLFQGWFGFFTAFSIFNIPDIMALALGQKVEKFDMTFECENGYLKIVNVGKQVMASLYFNGDREYSEHYLKALFVLKRLYEYGDEDVKRLMKETHIDPTIKWFSNSPGPYSGYPHKSEYNKRVYPVTVYDLCQEFQKIRDYENRFCWDNFDKNSYVFYYCWKE